MCHSLHITNIRTLFKYSHNSLSSWSRSFHVIFLLHLEFEQLFNDHLMAFTLLNWFSILDSSSKLLFLRCSVPEVLLKNCVYIFEQTFFTSSILFLCWYIHKYIQFFFSYYFAVLSLFFFPQQAIIHLLPICHVTLTIPFTWFIYFQSKIIWLLFHMSQKEVGRKK